MNKNSIKKRLHLVLGYIPNTISLSLFNSQTLAEITQKKHLLCMGDSHVRIFDYVRRHYLLNASRIDTLAVSGATAQGMVNPNSKTDALKSFSNRLTKAKSWQHLIFSLGEVDCGFVIWYRAEKHRISIQSQVEYSINNYLNFLKKVKSFGFSNIYVVSVPLPTIVDGQIWGEVANLRQEVKASQKERTELTIEYNCLLKQACHAEEMFYIDVTSEQLDHKTGLIDKAFLNKNPLDHHLDSKQYANVLVQKLEQCFSNDFGKHNLYLQFKRDYR
jgi:hypothetical protein